MVESHEKCMNLNGSSSAECFGSYLNEVRTSTTWNSVPNKIGGKEDTNQSIEKAPNSTDLFPFGTNFQQRKRSIPKIGRKSTAKETKKSSNKFIWIESYSKRCK